MELIEILENRRSVRTYTGEPLSGEEIEMIVNAGLLSPSSRGKQSAEFIVVRDRETLKKLSECREGSAKMLAGAQCAIVVIGNESLTDVWTEDCSIAMSNMHLMADSLGLGSCWIQGRLRTAPDGRTTEEYVRECLGFPEDCRLEGILSIGRPQSKGEPRSVYSMSSERIHMEKY